MRGFMRAIGLGGLFRRSRGSSGMRPSMLRPIANPFIAVLEEKNTSSSSSSSQHMSTTASRVLVEPSRESRTSSVVERPQFLFFCGSESTSSSGSRTPSLSSARMTATLKQQQLESDARAAPQPVISHRMPVFFSAHCAFPTLSPTSTSARPSESIFN